MANGEDEAASLLEASKAGDTELVYKLLAQPEQQAIALTTTHRIYQESEDDVVFAMPILNLKAMVQRALEARQSACMTSIVRWGEGHGVPADRLFDWMMILEAIDDLEVLEALLEVYPPALRVPLSHAHNLLIQAVYRNDAELVRFLLDKGLTPTECELHDSSMMFEAALDSSAEIVEMLIQAKGRVVGTGAMHAAASRGKVKTMRKLLPHLSTNLNDSFSNAFLQTADPELQWTPMHFAAAEKQRKAFEWLRRHGGDATLMDALGQTPHDLLAD